MRKMLFMVASMLSISVGVLSSEAMEIEVRSQGQLVPRSCVPLSVQSDEWEQLSHDWFRVGSAFFHDLSSGGRSDFDKLLPSLEELHPVCRFVARVVLSCVLDSRSFDRLELRNRCGFFGDAMAFDRLIGSALLDDEERIDEQKLVDLMLTSMGEMITEEIRVSIRSAWGDYMRRHIETLEKEEELNQNELQTRIELEKLKQCEVECAKRRLQAETDAYVEELGLRRLEGKIKLAGQLRELKLGEVSIRREQLKFRVEEGEVIWKEENPVLSRVIDGGKQIAEAAVPGVISWLTGTSASNK